MSHQDIPDDRDDEVVQPQRQIGQDLGAQLRQIKPTVYDMHTEYKFCIRQINLRANSLKHAAAMDKKAYLVYSSGMPELMANDVVDILNEEQYRGLRYSVKPSSFNNKMRIYCHWD